MKLPSRTFAQFVQDMSAVVQGSVGDLFNFSPGSVLRAVIEANASVALWMQWLALNVLKAARAATCAGTDLDAWMADFSISRLPPSKAYGTLTFSRYVADSSTAAIPANTVVKTGGGTSSFSVTIEPGATSWSASQGAYIIPPGAASLTVPGVALSAGTSGNVSANTITLIASAVPGIDSVTNDIAFVGGTEAESDDSFRLRFQNFMATRSRATAAAIAYAITGTQQNIDCYIAENVDTQGKFCPGSFTITINDGTDSPAPALISTIVNAVDLYRPVGCRFFVEGPIIVPVTISATAVINGDAGVDGLRDMIIAAIQSYVSGLSIGATLSATRIAEAVYKVDERIRYLSNIKLNGDDADITAPSNGVIRCTNVTVG